jgi:hypothetical protein
MVAFIAIRNNAIEVDLRLASKKKYALFFLFLSFQKKKVSSFE